MRVPVFTVLPSEQSLLESATAFVAGAAPTGPLDATSLPSNFEIDPSFPAVALGSTMTDGAASSFTPGASEHFAVRGTVEVADISEVPHEIDGRPLYADPAIAPFLTCAGTPSVGGVPQVQAKLNTAALTANGRGLDGTNVAVVIMDTGINLAHVKTQLGGAAIKLDAANSWTPPGSTTPPGQHPVNHGTMCAYDVLIAAPNATLVDFPILASTAPGGAMTGSTLSVAFQAYAQLISSWAVAFAAGSLGTRYHALVVNNSWGIYHPSWDFPAGHPGRYIDNPNHPFNLLVGVLARSNADILFAAGNCGSQCPDMRCKSNTTGAIMGANALADVLTLAGCDTTDQRVGYSSQGPSIANMFQNKPDIAAYTHFAGSQAFGATSPDAGTSAACPVAAGCIAALRSKLKAGAVPSANLYAQLRATARRPPGVAAAGWNADYGFGIIDPDAAGQSLGV